MSINEPSADALDLVMFYWGEMPQLQIGTDGDEDPCYLLFRELERAGYLHISRASNFKHKVWLTKTGLALASMLPPLEEARMDYFVQLTMKDWARRRANRNWRP